MPPNRSRRPAAGPGLRGGAPQQGGAPRRRRAGGRRAANSTRAGARPLPRRRLARSPIGRCSGTGTATVPRCSTTACRRSGATIRRGNSARAIRRNSSDPQSLRRYDDGYEERAPAEAVIPYGSEAPPEKGSTPLKPLQRRRSMPRAPDAEKMKQQFEKDRQARTETVKLKAEDSVGGRARARRRRGHFRDDRARARRRRRRRRPRRFAGRGPSAARINVCASGRSSPTRTNPDLTTC